MAVTVSVHKQNDDNEGGHERRHGLQTPAIRARALAVVAAALACFVCLSSPHVVIASSRQIPQSRRASGTGSVSGLINRFGFLYPRNNNNKNRVPRVSPSSAAAPKVSSSSSLRLSSNSLEGENEKRPSPSSLNNTLSATSTYGRADANDETRVTTTSFFPFPSESMKPLESQQLEGLPGWKWRRLVQESPSSIRPRQILTQAQIQTKFVVSLMGLAGFVEGFCIRRHGCFPNLMTGTILKATEAFGNWNLSAASIQASMVCCYIGGGYIFSRWNKTAPTKRNPHEQKKASLKAISVLSGLMLLLSDFVGGLTPLKSFKLPLLAAAFGIINAGTVDVGAGVTYAMTGHVTKLGQGLATGNLAKNKDPSATPKAHRTSAQGLVVFSAAALVANLLCGVLETTGTATTTLPLRVSKIVLEKLPLGASVIVAYAWLFRWYIGASAKASRAEAAKTK